jgi:hypothetical protein
LSLLFALQNQLSLRREKKKEKKPLFLEYNHHDRALHYRRINSSILEVLKQNLLVKRERGKRAAQLLEPKKSFMVA